MVDDIMKFGSSKKKGQYFIVMTVLLCSLFYVGMPKQSPLSEPIGKGMNYLYENIQKEMPSVLNYGYNDSVSYAYLKNFTNFVDDNSTQAV